MVVGYQQISWLVGRSVSSKRGWLLRRHLEIEFDRLQIVYIYIYIPIGSVQSLACKLRIQAFTTSYKATVEQMGHREQGAEGGSYYVVTI